MTSFYSNPNKYISDFMKFYNIRNEHCCGLLQVFTVSVKDASSVFTKFYIVRKDSVSSLYEILEIL